METWFADVIVPLKVDGLFTYRIPQSWNNAVQAGQRVLVPFGKSHFYTGLVYRTHQQAPEAYTAKYAEALLDETAVLDAVHLKFWMWMAHYYMCSPGDVMQAALPAALKLSTQSIVQLNPDFDFEQSQVSDFSAREHQLLDVLHASGAMPVEAVAIRLQLKSIQPILKKLLEKQAVLIEDVLEARYKPRFITYLQWHKTQASEIEQHCAALQKRAPQQAAALLQFSNLLSEHALTEIKKTTALQHISAAALKALIQKQFIKAVQKSELRIGNSTALRTPYTLNTLQSKALAEIKLHFKNSKPVLLHGVTGSGKTELYIHIIQEYLQQGAQVLYLIPEIALTTQLIERLTAVFGDAVGVYHSRFNAHARAELWHEVSKAHAQSRFRVLVGARSAVFLPFKHLKCIIVDEEHDTSFKQQDPAPRYHARDVAFYLARLYGAQLLLGSATPSIEAQVLCTEDKMAYVGLGTQFAAGGGTELRLCDRRQHMAQRDMEGVFTPPLKNAITEALQKQQQVLLFQNRRGLVPLTECSRCGYVAQCRQCDVSLIRHKASGRMHCHYCGTQSEPPVQCPVCKSQLWSEKGFGTERVEEDVQRVFPQARVARMDQDSARSRTDYLRIFEAFAAREIDILIGTQMVSKGLDFKHIAVAGILNADALWHFPDFRAQERAYQTIVQVKGRAGRLHTVGQVYIQTAQPEHPVIQTLVHGTETAFYQNLINERRTFGYPPFTRLLEITLKSLRAEELNHLADMLSNDLKTCCAQVLGPETPLVGKIKNQHLKRILIKWPRYEAPKKLRQLVNECLVRLKTKHPKWNYRIDLNIDPY
ncbi:MAG: replication restart helicase PriA [Bacteroidia bacterium]